MNTMAQSNILEGNEVVAELLLGQLPTNGDVIRAYYYAWQILYIHMIENVTSKISFVCGRIKPITNSPI